VLKICSTPPLGRMALPGVSGRKYQGRLKVNPWGFGVKDTEYLRPAVLN